MRGHAGGGGGPLRGGGRSDARFRARLGADAEALAARHLERAGLRILDRNWRSGRRELDLVALEGEVVAFVEVRARRDGPEDPLESLDWKKRRDLRRAAEAWVHAHPGVGREFRFDVVGVRASPGTAPEVNHVRGAFTGDDC